MNFCLSISLYYCTELVTFHCFLWVYIIEKPSETKRKPVEEDSPSSDEEQGAATCQNTNPRKRFPVEEDSPSSDEEQCAATRRNTKPQTKRF